MLLCRESIFTVRASVVAYRSGEVKEPEGRLASPLASGTTLAEAHCKDDRGIN
jgi:hypothetical protein